MAAKKSTSAQKTRAAKKSPAAKKSAASKKSSAAKRSAPAKKSKLAQIKTQPTATKVADFINKVPDEQKRKGSFALVEMMKKASGDEPVMWGSSIIGFGNVRYKSPATGREVDWMKIGFSPRKANLTLYLMGIQQHAAALKKLGKHKVGGGCLYINKLEDVDTKVLQEIIEAALKSKLH